MTLTLPAFYDNLDGSLEQAWHLLKDGARNRKSPMHTPVVASLNSEGQPSQRILVLREVSDRRRGLRFHTDLRSTKVGEFGASHKQAKPVSILAYHAEERVQLRLSGKAWIEQNSDTSDVAWHSSTNFARRCYLTEHGPGTAVDAPTSGLPTEIEGIQPTDEQIAPARDNFAVLLAEINMVEWLYLANAGHRRAHWSWNADAKEWCGEWLVP